MKLFLRRGVWYVRLFRHGREIRKSCGTRSEKQARKVAEGLQREITLGRFAPEWERLTWAAMADALRRQYRRDERRSMKALEARLKHLRFFEGYRLAEINRDFVHRYVDWRLEQHASNATINRELAAFSAAYRVSGAPRPRIPHLNENNVRQGFVEWPDFKAIRGELPARLRGLTTVLYVTAWRFRAVAHLQWRDIGDDAIRVRPEFSKNNQALEFPLNDILREAIGARGMGYVFPSPHGGPYRDIRIAWKSACRRAGYPRLLLHDLCRSGVRNMVRTRGITENTAMKLAGRRTRAILDRYDIVSLEDRQSASASLNEYLEGQTERRVTPIRKLG